MKFSYISHLHCPKCQKRFSAGGKHQLCECGSPLLVDYDLKEIGKVLKPTDLLTRNTDLWRYHELLPVQNKENVVTLGEGMTPFCR